MTGIINNKRKGLLLSALAVLVLAAAAIIRLTVSGAVDPGEARRDAAAVYEAMVRANAETEMAAAAETDAENVLSEDIPAELPAEASFAAAEQSLLYIRGYNAAGELKSTGSGFLVSPEGLAVTAAHVIDGGARITAITRDGEEAEAEVLRCDLPTDIALLRLPDASSGLPFLTMAKGPPAAGATVRVLGYPIKDTLIITEGIVAAPFAVVSEKERMLLNCAIVNGMSGGPVLDGAGRVVGMASGSVRTMDGIHLSALSEELFAAVAAEQTGNIKEAEKSQ